MTELNREGAKWPRALGYLRRGRAPLCSALGASLLFCSLSVDLFARPPRDAQSHEERLTKLYGHDPRFTTGGEPIVSLGLASGLKALSVSSLSGFKVYLDGDPDNEVTVAGLKRWEVRLKQQSAPLRAERWEILDERPVTRASELSQLEEQWRGRGVRSVVRFQRGLYVPKSATTGSEAFEGRVIMLAYRPSDELDLSAHLKGRTLESLETLVSPARGLIIADGYEEQRLKKRRAKAQRPMSTLTSRDVLWFESNGDQPVTLTYLGEDGEERSASYHKELYVAVDRQGLSVVSVLPTERLIEGVVPSELYRSAPIEALKAQAIAARGQVVVKLGARHLTDPFMMCASTHCQAYKGLDQHHKRTSAATRETRGMIAMSSEGHPLDSVYSSTCGGHTEAYHEVWGGAPKPHLMGVEDNAKGSRRAVSASSVEAFIKVPTAAFCQEPKRTFRWSVKRSASELLERLESGGHVETGALGELVGFEALRRGSSGRVQAVTYRGTNGSAVVYGDYVNRVILGVKSGLWVSDELSKGAWRLSGGGFGHGVGMCQHGAMGMAKAGAQADEIILHYYAGAQVKTLW